jgi:sterol desaturase/sphingolipid hydroxylase (fatty acid hydroxylase superfamily)
MRSFLTSAVVLSSLYVLVFVIERRPRSRFRDLPFRRRYFLTDATWYGLIVGMSAVAVFVLRPIFDRIAIGPVARLVRDLPPLGRFALALLLFDGISYGVHRGMHRSALLWNIHKVHHSTLELDGLAATRQHLLENMIRFLPSQFVMFLVGIPTAQVAPAVATGAAFAVVTHSNLNFDLWFMERLFVTPRLHRRHHVPATAMNNYGGIFNLWDRLFGSFISLDTSGEERFGCPGEIDTYPQRFRDAIRQPPRDMKAQLRRRTGTADVPTGSREAA